MPDMEKVIKELESLRDICNAKSNMAIGKGKIAWAGYANTADDAIAMLKEMEGYKTFYNSVINQPNCNTCGIKSICVYCPRPGGDVVFNCPMWIKDD